MEGDKREKKPSQPPLGVRQNARVFASVPESLLHEMLDRFNKKKKRKRSTDINKVFYDHHDSL